MTPLGPTLTACYHFESHQVRTKLLRLELDHYGRTLDPEPDLFRPNLYALPQYPIPISRSPTHPGGLFLYRASHYCADRVC